MPRIAAHTDAHEHLVFAASESKSVGMRGPLIERMRDNAPRIVGLMKIGMDVAVAFTGSPWLIAYSTFAIIGRLISIGYGSKAHQDKLAEEKAEGKHQKILGHSLRENDRKILFPRKYPVESSAGLSVIAETFGVGFGITRQMERLAAAAKVMEMEQLGASAEAIKMAKDSIPGSGWTAIITGLIAVWSYSNILFHKEKKKSESVSQKEEASEPLPFAKSESKTVGFTGRLRQMMKDNPVLVSSMVNVAICAAMFVGGLIEGYGMAYLVASAIGGLANLTQGLLVRKHDYNVEGAQEKAKTPSTFEERLTQQRSRSGDLGAQPA